MVDRSKISENLSHLGLDKIGFLVLESIEDWVRVMDKNGIEIYANKSLRDFRQQSLDRGEHALLTSNQGLSFQEHLTGITLSSTSALTREETIGDRWFSIKSSPITDAQGHVLSVVEVYRDVTRENTVRKDLYNTNRKMVDDLRFARKLQRCILPKSKTFQNVHFAQRFLPTSELSGDMFDIIEIDEDKVAVYISDVAGHGVTASMLTMFVNQTIRTLVLDEKCVGPSETLFRLRDNFIQLDMPDEQYLTVFYMVVDVKKMTVTYANAGHNSQPILFNEKGCRVVDGRGLPITKIFSIQNYRESTAPIEAGDKILFYTDGITETKNYKGEFFGEERLLSVLNADDPEDVLDKIVNRASRFRWGEQMDDIALLLLDIQ